MLAIAIGGAIFAALGATYGPTGESPPKTFVLIGILAVLAHIIAAFVGSWRIYRPSSKWARAFVMLGISLGCLWAFLSITNESVSVGRSVLLLATRGTAMSWAMFEAFRYSSMLRRRMAFGLADPMMTHRFWLWGVGAAAQFMAIGLDLMLWLGTGAGLDGSAAGVHVMAALGLIGATTTELAFFPPKRYQTLISGHAVQLAG